MDFIFVDRFPKKDVGNENAKLYTFNRFDLVNSDPSTYSGNVFTQVSFYSSENSESDVSFFKWGDVYSRNDYTEHNKPLDYEGLLNFYNEFGSDFVRKCKGSFVIILKKGKSISVFTDQLHPRTVYYYYAKGLLLISSSLSAMIQFLRKYKHPTEANIQYLIEYFLYDYSLNDSSLILDVSETQPGQIIHFSDGRKTITSYFDVINDLDCSGPKMNSDEGIEYLKDVFKANVSLYDRGPDNTAVALTGGYDSRSVIASLGENYRDYQYYSYGRPESWDVKVPEKIALGLSLDYKPFILDREYESRFIENGELALLLSDGTGKISLGNYVHVYSKFFNGKTSILTGLFGSELIKRFSGANIAMSQNMLDILKADAFNVALFTQLNHAKDKNYFSSNTVEYYKDSILHNLNNNVLINNGLAQNKKIFLHYLSLGTRKYFQQELNIQSPWITNLHPFYDIDFIEALLKTPYPNLYNWKLKKSLIKNLKTHKLYWGLINQRPELSGFISTHGFKPKHLRSKLFTPLIAIDYITTKKRVKRETNMTNRELTQIALEFHLSENKINEDSIFFKMISSADKRSATFLKMFSTFLWLKKHNIYI